MPVIGFGLEKISAEKNQIKDRNVKVNSNIDVQSIEKEKIENLNQEVLRVNFKFIIIYEPKLAKIELFGFLLYSTDKKQALEILKKWKSKKIPDEVRIPLFNFILTKCNLKALQLEEELSLPSHIPLPRLTPQQQGNNRPYVQ